MVIEKLNGERVKHWLMKTTHSISNCKGPSDLAKNYHKNELCIRYNELKDRAKLLGIWLDYCNEFGWAPDHDGYDCAA